ncbi:fibrinogen gamma chain-like [Tubulanus polymorphus]|uniref:fibrinogen gamma chain-like n=1 Tax=Tubulanus polymorphus TaxID=672921 RepID=UPI003DA4BFEC
MVKICQKVNPCKNAGKKDVATGRCKCVGAWTGTTCNALARDCWTYLVNHAIEDGNKLLLIQPAISTSPFYVSCYLHSSGSGIGSAFFAVHDRGSIGFDRTWQEYVDGFGQDLTTVTFPSSYFMGLERLHQITSNAKSYNLILSLEFSDGSKSTLNYRNFKVGDATVNYKLSYTSFTQAAGRTSNPTNNEFEIESSKSPKNMAFSTPDRDNDQSPTNCATSAKSGWWFNDCTTTPLFSSTPRWGGRDLKRILLAVA